MQWRGVAALLLADIDTERQQLAPTSQAVVRSQNAHLIQQKLRMSGEPPVDDDSVIRISTTINPHKHESRVSLRQK